MAKKYHPDLNPSTHAKERFSKILLAYETLSDNKQRDLYDLESDYSTQGNWKGFNSNPYANQSQSSSSQNPNSKGRARSSTRRQKSQGFWDDPHAEWNSNQTKDDDEFDDFFFTGKKSAQPKDKDKTRGMDLEVDIEIGFMEAIRGGTHNLTIKKDTTCNI